MITTLQNLAYVVHYNRDDERATALFRESLVLSWESGVKGSVPAGLAGLASVAGRQGKPVRAATLFGAAQGLLDAIGIAFEVAERDQHTRAIAAARAQLDDAAFKGAWEEGRAMTLEQVIAYALDEPAAPQV